MFVFVFAFVFIETRGDGSFFVNSDNITLVRQSIDNNTCRIIVVTGKEYHVQESAESLLNRIKETK